MLSFLSVCVKRKLSAHFLRALTEQYIPPPRQPKIAAHNPIVR